MTTQLERFGGRFTVAADAAFGPIDVRDEAPWLQCVGCGHRAAVETETYCTECGARLVQRTYAAYLSAVDDTRGPACLVDAGWAGAPSVLPTVWFDQVEGGRRLTIVRPIDGTAIADEPEPIEVLRLALALAEGLEALHGVGLMLGTVSREDLVLRAGRWHLRAVNALQPVGPLPEEAVRADLNRLAELVETLSATPRTTQRLDLAVESASSGTAESLATLLREVRTADINAAAVLVERLRSQLRDVSQPLMLFHACGSCSDVGRIRRHNEDSLLTLQLQRANDGTQLNGGLYAVADGMGGHAAGERASGLALQVLAEGLAGAVLALRATAYDAQQVATALADAVQAANRAVVEQSRTEGNDMGTTLVAALVVGDRVTLANVGDSRAYLWRDGRLQRLTRDHSLVQRLVDLGQIQPDDVYTHPQRNAVTASIGDRLNVRVDISTVQVCDGDALLLCSDGQWEMTRDPQMAELIAAAPTVQAACEALVAAANAAGGEDNISAVLVGFGR